MPNCGGSHTSLSGMGCYPKGGLGSGIVGRGTRTKDHGTLILAPYPWIKERDPRCAAQGPFNGDQSRSLQCPQCPTFRMAVHAPGIKSEGVWQCNGYSLTFQLAAIPDG